MKFATVRELSQNPSRFIDLTEPVVITKHGKPVRALVTMVEEDLEDFILAQRLELEKELERALRSSQKGKNIPSAKLKAQFEKRRTS